MLCSKPILYNCIVGHICAKIWVELASGNALTVVFHDDEVSTPGFVRRERLALHIPDALVNLEWQSVTR